MCSRPAVDDHSHLSELEVVSSALLRILMQDAMSEVLKIYMWYIIQKSCRQCRRWWAGSKLSSKKQKVESSLTKELRNQEISLCGAEGMGLADNVEVFKIDIRHRRTKLDKKERGKRRKCVQRIGFIKKTKKFRKGNIKTGTNKILRMVVLHVDIQRLWHGTTTKRSIEKPFGQCVSHSLFVEINNLEVELVLACAVTRFWVQAVKDLASVQVLGCQRFFR